MTKYYFLITCLFCGLCGHSQECGWVDLLVNVEKWSGDVDRFGHYHDAWQLDDSKAGRAEITFYPELPTRALQFTFSLDFPPSDANRFRMTIGLQSPDGTDSSKVILSVGESGDQDGVLMSYYSGRQLVKEEKYWDGLYGAGAERSTWTMGVKSIGMSINNGGNYPARLITWEGQNNVDLFISSISLECKYTRTRSTHFSFHHLYSNEDADFTRTSINPGDLFISEYRYNQQASGDYLELYNAFTESVCLTGLRIQVDGVSKEIPPMQVDPGVYILLVDSSFDLVSDPSTKRIEINLPFVNGGDPDVIRLFNYNRLIHAVYPPDHDPEPGGLSWEMVDVTQPCRTDNWKSSMNEEGSPGQENSWFSTLDLPKLTYRWETRKTGKLSYPYLMIDQESVDQYITANHPFELVKKDERGTFEMHFVGEFLPDDSVIVKVKGEFMGCGGEILKWDTIFIESPPQKGQVRGLLFTELMYDPPASCPEYVEITNMESRVTWWDTLSIQKGNGNSVPLDLPFAWPSGQSRVITSDKEQFLRCYQETKREVVFLNSLFALTNSGATLSLVAHESEDRMIDEVSYSPSDHNDLFKNTKGVALERNLLATPSNKWRSGFVQFGYRSPGFLPEWNMNSDVDVAFSTSTIYSQNGSFPSALEIEISSNGVVGGSLTIEIFDLKGRKIETFVDAVPIQGGELFTWKGRTKTGLLLPEGLYLFWIYYFDLNGRKRIFKKTCVLSNF